MAEQERSSDQAIVKIDYIAKAYDSELVTFYTNYDIIWSRRKHIMLCTQDIDTDNKRKPLAEHFKDNRISDKQIADTFLDGYKQISIAQYLKISSTSVSRRIRRYCDKQEFFSLTKQKGLFWSYDSKLEYSETLDPMLIETILKYGDFADLKKLFSLYGKTVVKKVWKEKIINDTRFTKLNYFLARIFFGMDVEADFFKGGVSDREKKLRMLAS